MAAKSSLCLLFFTFFFLLICSSISARPSKTLYATAKNMVFYVQETRRGPNATVSVIGGVNGTSSNMSSFGTIFVIDNPVTQGPEYTSKLLGRIQGLEANSDHRGTNFHLVASVIFDSGSTLEISGVIRTLFVQRKLSVVGGSGRFRHANGYGLINIVAYDGVLLTFKFNVTVRSY